MEKYSLWKSVAAVLVLLSALVLAAWFVIQFTDSSFVLGVIGAVVAIMTAAFQYRAAKDRETDARLFSQKQEAYSELIETVMGLFGGVKGKSSKLSEAQLADKLQSIKIKLLIWGSYETLSALSRAAELGTKSDETSLDVAARGTEWLSELFEGSRSDLGHKDPTGAGLELALSILNEPDKTSVRNHLKSRKK